MRDEANAAGRAGFSTSFDRLRMRKIIRRTAREIV
jgi:hypothetical protein